jgi:hypothetical protein
MYFFFFFFLNTMEEDKNFLNNVSTLKLIWLTDLIFQHVLE